MMAKPPKTPPHGAAQDEYAKPPSADRRRWLKAGLSTPPVLMTVASRPVLAAACVPPSAYVSLDASAPGMYGYCSGDGPNTWVGNSSWDADGYTPGSPFNASFEPDLDGDPSFLDVLGYAGNEDIQTVARYVTAALLNHASGKVHENVLRAMTIKHIWTEFRQKGFFAPTSGASWRAAEIVHYLESTIISA